MSGNVHLNPFFACVPTKGLRTQKMWVEAGRIISPSRKDYQTDTLEAFLFDRGACRDGTRKQLPRERLHMLSMAVRCRTFSRALLYDGIDSLNPQADSIILSHHFRTLPSVCSFSAFLRNERFGQGNKIARTRWKISININKNNRKKAIFLPISTHKTVYTQFLMPLHFVLPHISPHPRTRTDRRCSPC